MPEGEVAASTQSQEPIEATDKEEPSRYATFADWSAHDERAVAPVSLPKAGGFLVLTPDNDVQEARSLGGVGHHVIAFSDRELIFVNGHHRYRCGLPTHSEDADTRLPVARKVVGIAVHHRAIGPVSEGHRFVYAIDSNESVIGRLDNSDGWPLRFDRLEQLCRAARLGWELERFENVESLLATHPTWIEPELEFEVDHPREESARQLGQAIFFVSGLAFTLGGVAMGLFLQSPTGHWYRFFAIACGAVGLGLTLWSTGQWRLRRSLTRRERVDKCSLPTSPAE